LPASKAPNIRLGESGGFPSKLIRVMLLLERVNGIEPRFQACAATTFGQCPEKRRMRGWFKVGGGSSPD
jgi:hypothetical protein